MLDDVFQIGDLDVTVDHLLGVDEDIGADVAEIDRITGVDQHVGIEPLALHLKPQSSGDVVRALLHAVRGRADQDVLSVPVHRIHSSTAPTAGDAAGCRLPESVLNTKAAARIGPLDVVKLVADDPAGTALDAALVREQDRPIRLWRIAGRRAAVDALLSLA